MRKSFTLDDGQIFHYRSPKMRELIQLQEAANAGDMASAMQVVSGLVTSADPNVVYEMDIEEFVRWQDQLGNSLAAGQPTSQAR